MGGIMIRSCDDFLAEPYDLLNPGKSQRVMRDEEQCLFLAVQIQENAVHHDGGRFLIQSGCWLIKQQNWSLTGKC